MSVLNKLLSNFEQLLLYPDVSTDEQLARYEELVSVDEFNPLTKRRTTYSADEWSDPLIPNSEESDYDD